MLSVRFAKVCVNFFVSPIRKSYYRYKTEKFCIHYDMVGFLLLSHFCWCKTRVLLCSMLKQRRTHQLFQWNLIACSSNSSYKSVQITATVGWNILSHIMRFLFTVRIGILGKMEIVNCGLKTVPDLSQMRDKTKTYD